VVKVLVTPDGGLGVGVSVGLLHPPLHEVTVMVLVVKVVMTEFPEVLSGKMLH
jgi:hypothetical protein